jgi:hypothetical protein
MSKQEERDARNLAGRILEILRIQEQEEAWRRAAEAEAEAERARRRRRDE